MLRDCGIPWVSSLKVLMLFIVLCVLVVTSIYPYKELHNSEALGFSVVSMRGWTFSFATEANLLRINPFNNEFLK